MKETASLLRMRELRRVRVTVVAEGKGKEDDRGQEKELSRYANPGFVVEPTHLEMGFSPTYHLTIWIQKESHIANFKIEFCLVAVA